MSHKRKPEDRKDKNVFVRVAATEIVAHRFCYFC